MRKSIIGILIAIAFMLALYGSLIGKQVATSDLTLWPCVYTEGEGWSKIYGIPCPDGYEVDGECTACNGFSE